MLRLKERAFAKGFHSFMSSSAVGGERELRPRQAPGKEDLPPLSLFCNLLRLICTIQNRAPFNGGALSKIVTS